MPHVSNIRQVVWSGVLPLPEGRETYAEEAVFERVFFVIERRAQASRAGIAGARVARSSVNHDRGYKTIGIGDKAAAIGERLTVPTGLEEGK